MALFINDTLNIFIPVNWLLNRIQKNNKNYQIYTSVSALSLLSSVSLPLVWNTEDAEKNATGFVFLSQKGIHFDPLTVKEEYLKNYTVFFVEGEIQIFLFDLFSSFIKNWKKFEHIPLIGVTGTNGKTSTTIILSQIIKLASSGNPLVIGTLGTLLNGVTIPRRSAPTMPSCIEFTILVALGIERGASHIIFEATSHGLHQNRLGLIKASVAVFLNLTQDHLDYHGNMDNYASAKRLLFSNHLKVNGLAIINANSPYYKDFINDCKKLTPFVYLFSNSTSPNELDEESYLNLTSTDVQFSLKGFTATLQISNKSQFPMNFPLLGKFQLDNVLASIAVCYGLGIPVHNILNALARTQDIPGRLEKIPHKRFILIDYAHTPDALNNSLETINSLNPKGRVITIFGCGGERDSSKRSEMGLIASQFSSLCIVTSDNPRSENPNQIMDNIKLKIPTFDRNKVILIENREEAIKYALKILRDEDVLAILGKGHEEFQEINGFKYPFSDKKVVLNLLGTEHSVAKT